MNKEKLLILNRAKNRLYDLSKFALKRNEFTMAKNMEEEYIVIKQAIEELENK